MKKSFGEVTLNQLGPNPGIPVVGDRRIKSTVSVCPECLRKIDAEVVARAGQVWLEKSCPSHGEFNALLSSSEAYYHETSARFPNTGSCCGVSPDPAASIAGGDTPWANHSCTILIEITERCNLSCPTCFAGSSPNHTKMMDMATFKSRVDGLLAGGKQASDTIQLSGGEPTIHPNLFEMVDHLYSSGFMSVTINSNGIKLAQAGFAERLAECKNAYPSAELFVYLQFDGFDDSTHEHLRGRSDLLPLKRRALEACVKNGIKVHPVMTLTRGINDHEVGRFVSIAIENPAIKHIVIQPAMYSGRYENARRIDRLTLADTAELIIAQLGIFETEDFGPIPCSDPNCHGIAVAVRSGDGLIPISRYFPRIENWNDEEARDLIDRFSNSLDGPAGMAAALQWALSDERAAACLNDVDDSEIERLLDAICEDSATGDVGWERMLTISIKPFMDAWTYDQDRIDKCCVHILDDQGTPVSLCEFNAINRPQLIRGEHHASNAV